jgi:hypothetical protein
MQLKATSTMGQALPQAAARPAVMLMAILAVRARGRRSYWMPCPWACEVDRGDHTGKKRGIDRRRLGRERGRETELCAVWLAFAAELCAVRHACTVVAALS